MRWDVPKNQALIHPRWTVLTMSAAPGEEYLTRAVVFLLDPTPAQERLLRSYCGAARFAHNWALGQVKGLAAEPRPG